MPTITKQLKSLPNSPGIYLFYNSRRELIYVGKATSLKNRVKSYFTGNQKSFRPIESMIDEVIKIKTIKTDSVLEAIILEGQYIKKFRPKYNVDWKDDKSWNYLAITNDQFPRLIAIRQHEISVIPAKAGIQTKKQKEKNWIPGSRRPTKTRRGSSPEDDRKKLFGPYPRLNTRETLKLLHKLFYLSRCSPPFLTKEGAGGGKKSKPCFDYQLGQCLGVCTGEITPKDYKTKVVKPLTEFLKGHKKILLTNLKKQMLLASKQENFEEAGRLRNQIKSLQHVQDVTLLNKDLFNNSYQPTALPTYRSNRIEAYDISNLGSTGKVGSMVVFNQSGPVKSEYRKFKIKTISGQSDVDCLKEIITRRFNNNWPLPDLILVDGGVPQVNAIKNILQNVGAQNLVPVGTRRGAFSPNIPVIGLAKGPTRHKNEFIFDRSNKKIADFIQANEILLIQARDEAHRFAITYQKKLRKIF
ncbi:MAG TPA: GIY-YIG nuclease family protein [Patescibacteria group bacterium]|nr:GIY-YIG nuclease family protein [Patescibacteria group bacterium]